MSRNLTAFHSLKAVIFDLDNTLYDYDAAHAAAFHALCGYAQTRLGISEPAFREVYDQIMHEQIERAGNLYAAIHNRMIRFQMILERIRKPILYAPEMSDLYWDAFLDICEPVPGVRETLETLRKRYVLGVGTNMTADYQFRKLQKLGLLDIIDFLVSSEEVSAEKPAGKFFAACAVKAGCPPEDCLFVGDNFAHDVQGAMNAGMRAVWLTPDPVNRAVPHVKTIPQLLELLP